MLRGQHMHVLQQTQHTKGHQKIKRKIIKTNMKIKLTFLEKNLNTWDVQSTCLPENKLSEILLNNSVHSASSSLAL